MVEEGIDISFAHDGTERGVTSVLKRTGRELAQKVGPGVGSSAAAELMRSTITEVLG